MKHLFNNFKIITVSLLVVLGLLTGSCSKDYGVTHYNGNTATIRLNIPVIKPTSRVDVNGDENTIKNLRVIILSQGAKSINRTFTSTELQSGSITIDGVPVGLVQMYVIANESSLGRNYEDLANLQKDVDQDTKKVHIKDEARQFFPKRGSEFPVGGLPMTWMDKNLTINIPGTEQQTIDVNLVRTVAKLNIQMSNALTTPIKIDKMSFGKFFGDCFFLFAESRLDVPDDANYDSKTYDNLAINIEGGKTEQLVLYLYPTKWLDPIEGSPFTIAFHTEGGKDYTEKVFSGIGEGSFNSISRNTQINIYATLSSPADVKIAFDVIPWEPINVDVPPFN